MSFEDGPSQTHLAFLVFSVYAVRIVQDYIRKCYNAYCMSKADRKKAMDEAEAKEQDYDEGLPTFFEALPGHLQKIWFTNEVYNRKTLGIKNIQKDMF